MKMSVMTMKTTKKTVAFHNANAANVWKERSECGLLIFYSALYSVGF